MLLITKCLLPQHCGNNFLVAIATEPISVMLSLWGARAYFGIILERVLILAVTVIMAAHDSIRIGSSYGTFDALKTQLEKFTR